jgi:hypothetical protein
MSDIFPRLNINLGQAAGIVGPAALRSIEAIKQDVIAQLNKYPSGTPFPAEIIAKLGDGSIVANVGNIPLRLALQMPQAKVGDKLNLTLLQTNPRLTFSIDGKQATALFEAAPREHQHGNTNLPNHEESASKEKHSGVNVNEKSLPSSTEPDQSLNARESSAPINTKNAVLGVNSAFKDALRSYQQNGIPTEASAHIDLSPTGKILAAVLSESNKPDSKLTLLGNAPLADDITARANPSRLATRIETQLNTQIEQSGLFYESHVSQWAEGKKDLADLQQEPQSTLSLESENTILTDSHEAKHAALTQLVHQQLDVLDQGRLMWTGMLTESVSMQMQIESVDDESTQSDANQPDKAQTWRTTLNLHFPKLGEVQIAISLRDKASDIQCKVETPELVQTLHQHAKELIKAFDASGNQLHSMKVSSK